MSREYKDELLRKAAAGTARVFTDPIASPTGFPFKVATLEKTMSDQDVYLARTRICDLGYLRETYQKEDGALGYRCPSEPVDIYLSKGGTAENAAGRKCLCNSLMANIGSPQIRKWGYEEQPLITCGDDLVQIARFLQPGRDSYSAQDVVKALLAV